jgi:hypothetical protein
MVKPGRKAKPESHPPSRPAAHEFLTIEQFADRVHRSRHTVYRWLRTRRDLFPEGSVVRVAGHLEIDWDVFKASFRKVI